MIPQALTLIILIMMIQICRILIQLGPKVAVLVEIAEMAITRVAGQRRINSSPVPHLLLTLIPIQTEILETKVETATATAAMVMEMAMEMEMEIMKGRNLDLAHKQVMLVQMETPITAIRPKLKVLNRTNLTQAAAKLLVLSRVANNKVLMIPSAVRRDTCFFRLLHWQTPLMNQSLPEECFNHQQNSFHL